MTYAPLQLFDGDNRILLTISSETDALTIEVYNPHAGDDERLGAEATITLSEQDVQRLRAWLNEEYG